MAVSKKKAKDDPAMTRVRELWAVKHAEGWTQQQLGERMGYKANSARKSVSQFMGVHDPKIGTLRKFAKAVGITLAELCGEGKR